MKRGKLGVCALLTAGVVMACNEAGGAAGGAVEEPDPPAPSVKNFVAEHGRLQVKGNRIVGQHGRPVSLAGMSLFWSQWMPQFYTPQAIAWLHRDFGAGIVRAAIAVEPDGYLEHPEREFAKAVTVVDAAIAQGIYVIVDWHAHKAENHPEAAEKFFGDLAAKYGKRPNVIYEIFNEPLRVSWSGVLKPYSERVIAAIRQHDPDNLIVVGTPNWSQDVDAVIPDPLRDPNVAYVLHFYAGTHQQWYRDKAKKALAAGLPLMVTEWGTTNANGDGPVDRASTEEWMAFLRENHLTHLNWSIADKREASAALQPGASPTGGWKDADLTESGRYVRSLIRGWPR